MISLSGIYLKIAHFPVKIGLIGGVGGVPKIWFSLESSYFCYLGAHAKFRNPTFLLSGRKVRESEEERKIMASRLATMFMPAATGSARTPLGPISCFGLFGIVCGNILIMLILHCMKEVKLNNST